MTEPKVSKAIINYSAYCPYCEEPNDFGDCPDDAPECEHCAKEFWVDYNA